MRSSRADCSEEEAEDLEVRVAEEGYKEAAAAQKDFYAS
jgi:hypothetical protein